MPDREDTIEKRVSTTAWMVAVVAPALVSLIVLFSQMNPYPYQDDYGAILKFAVKWQQMQGFRARCVYVFSAQHNEYKLILEHALVAAELAATHHLNFRFLTGLGNLLFLPIGYVLWLGYPGEGKDTAQKLREFFPISLIVFSVAYWENLDWAMTGLQNIPVVLFALLAVYFLTADARPRFLTRSMMLACTLAVAAACTSANGFLLAPVGSVFLATGRAWRRLVVWNAVFAIPLAMYLYGYHRVAQEGQHSLAAAPIFFLEFVGWAVPVRWGAVAAGLMILGVAGMALRRRFDRISAFYAYAALWALMTAGLVAVVRGSGGFGISARYSIYSLLLVACCYVFLRDQWAEDFRGMERGLIAGCVLYFLLVDARAWKSLRIRNRMIMAGIHFYEADPAVNSPMIDPEVMRSFPQEKGAELVDMNEAVAAGIYSPADK